MTISEIQNISSKNTSISPLNKTTPDISFSEILDSKKQSISHTVKGQNITSASDDFNFKPKYKTFTTPGNPGFPGKEYYVEDNLTSNDKALLKQIGWTENYQKDDDLQCIAQHIATDRVDGILKGPITKEYLFGNDSGFRGLMGNIRSPEHYSNEMRNLAKSLFDIISEPENKV